jgi:hypothetical protein
MPVTDNEGPYFCKTMILSHFLGDGIINGGKGVSLMRWPPFNTKKIPGTYLY